MKFARAVFYFEAIVINFGVGLLCFVAPEYFVSNFVPEGLPALGNELIRWYGVLLWVLAYVGLRALRGTNAEALRFVIEALLFGDIAHLGASILYLRAGGATDAGTLFMLGMSLFLAGVRVGFLRQTPRSPFK